MRLDNGEWVHTDTVIPRKEMMGAWTRLETEKARMNGCILDMLWRHEEQVCQYVKYWISICLRIKIIFIYWRSFNITQTTAITENSSPQNRPDNISYTFIWFQTSKRGAAKLPLYLLSIQSIYWLISEVLLLIIYLILKNSKNECGVFVSSPLFKLIGHWNQIYPINAYVDSQKQLKTSW